MVGTIFITGTSSGIGQETARLFAGRGWSVVGTVRRMEDAAPLAGHPHMRILPLDVRDHGAVERIAGEALAAFGRVDAIVNNAGYFQMGPLETTTMEQVRAQFETNVFGAIAVTKAFLPHFRAQRSGTIVNVASISAENGYPFGSAYSASKAALAVLTEALAVELDGIGVRAKAVLPGLHATRIFTKVDVAASVPAEYRPLLSRFVAEQKAVRGGKPAVVAAAIWEAITDGRDDRVRYHAGPDAMTVARAKRLLGADAYWRFFRKALLRGPGALARRLAPQGDTAVEFGPNIEGLLGGAE